MFKNLIFGDYSKVGLNNKSNREAWIKNVLKSIPEGESILDAGAGQLKNKQHCSHLNYVSQDFGQYDGEGDGKGIQTKTWDNSKLDIVSDIANIPVEENTFDNVLCSEVFEHIPHPIKAIKEFNRILKPNGKLIITAPFCSMTHFAPYHFYSGFNSYFYNKYLPENGFEIQELSPNANYFDYVGQELRFSFDPNNKYRKITPNLIQKLSLRFVLAFLQKNAEKSPESSELLNFGFHVICKKI
jgi:ubiquinone/menaquinone biosynthesis C-methylase UbiE